MIERNLDASEDISCGGTAALPTFPELMSMKRSQLLAIVARANDTIASLRGEANSRLIKIWYQTLIDVINRAANYRAAVEHEEREEKLAATGKTFEMRFVESARALLSREDFMLIAKKANEQ